MLTLLSPRKFARPLASGVRLGVDFGVARTGLAKVHLPSTLAVPVKTVQTQWDLADTVAEVAQELDAQLVYVGMPRMLTGGYSDSARKVMSFARELSELLETIDVYLIDERLTTVSAHQKLHQAGKTTRQFKAIVDQQAAVEILEHAVNLEVAQGKPAGFLVK